MVINMQYKEYIIEKSENNRLLIITDIHNCHIEWSETATYDRMEILCDSVNKEYEKRPYDGILSLGDYSLDFWKWDVGGSYLWEKPISRTEDFVKKFVHKLPHKMFMIPGNHEQYGKDDWERITGFPREYSVVYGDKVFVMLDTFAGNLDPREHSDGEYTGISTELLTEVLNNHPDKKIFLCAHDLIPSMESDKAREIILNNSRIVCAFTGHTHRDNTVILPDEWRNLPVFYCGDFSYNLSGDEEKNWGFRIVDFKNGVFSTEYVRV